MRRSGALPLTPLLAAGGNTHPPNTLSGQEKFSPDDVGFAQAQQKPYFVRTPSGDVRELSVKAANRPRVGKNSSRYVAGDSLCSNYDCSGL